MTKEVATNPVRDDSGLRTPDSGPVFAAPSWVPRHFSVSFIDSSLREDEGFRGSTRPTRRPPKTLARGE